MCDTILGSLLHKYIMERLQHVLFFALALFATPGSPFPATNKLSLATWGSYSYRDHKGPGTYAYGYDIEDPVTGNIQFKQEEKRSDGTVIGSYGYVDAEGVPRITYYVSDGNGFRVLADGPTNGPTNDNKLVSSGAVTSEFFQPPFSEIKQLQNQQGNQPPPENVKNGHFVQSPPPLMYEFQGEAPFLTYYKNKKPFPR